MIWLVECRGRTGTCGFQVVTYAERDSCLGTDGRERNPLSGSVDVLLVGHRLNPCRSPLRCRPTKYTMVVAWSTGGLSDYSIEIYRLNPSSQLCSNKHAGLINIW